MENDPWTVWTVSPRVNATEDWEGRNSKTAGVWALHSTEKKRASSAQQKHELSILNLGAPILASF
jgi:hypothetical protein